MAAAVRKVAAAMGVALVAACCCVPAHGASLPPCGTYEGVPHDASINGQCTLPDGEILESAVWAGRNPGTPVNYNVNWTYGGDGSKPNGGFAAIHGCQGDNVTFFIEGSGKHQLALIATQAQAPCGFDNAEVASDVVEAPAVVVVNFTGRNGFFNYADNQDSNCEGGSMHIQIIFHSFPTPKYGCYAPNKTPPGLPTYPPAPPALQEFTSGAPVSASPLPSPTEAPAPAPQSAPVPSPGPAAVPAASPATTAAAPSPAQSTATSPAPVIVSGPAIRRASPAPAPAASGSAPQTPVNELAVPSPAPSSPGASTAAAPTVATAPAPAPSAARRRAAIMVPAALRAVALLGLPCAVAAVLA